MIYPMMLANRWRSQNVGGWWLSEKLDGCRAFWDGESLRTRTWAMIAAPVSVTGTLPRGISLDGELWAGRGTFQRVSEAVRFGDTSDLRWVGVRYMIFDAPTTDDIPVEQRMETAERLATEAGAGWVAQRACAGAEDVTHALREVVAQGGEGLVLRRPGSAYDFRRSCAWLKVKPLGID